MLRKNYKALANIVLILVSFTIIFHLLVMIGVLPYDMIWGGRLESESSMYMLESVSLVVNFFILWFVSMKVGYTKKLVSDRILNIVFWIFAIIFALNTLGNLFSESRLEAFLFTPITIILAVCFLLLATKSMEE